MISPARKIRRILVPIDDSPGTRAVLDYAVLLGEALQAALTLVHIDERPSAMVGIVPGATFDDDLSAEGAASRAHLAELVDTLALEGFLDVTTLIAPANAIAPALVAQARDGHYDLIVMGTHARTGFSRLVIGSVAESVLRHAPCPVLAVHLPTET